MTLYLATIKYPSTEFDPSLEEFTYRLVEADSSKEAKELVEALPAYKNCGVWVTEPIRKSNGLNKEG